MRKGPKGIGFHDMGAVQIAIEGVIIILYGDNEIYARESGWEPHWQGASQSNSLIWSLLGFRVSH